MHIFPSLQLPFRVAELEELDEIAVAKFSALEELDDCTDVIRFLSPSKRCKKHDKTNGFCIVETKV